MCLPPPPTPPTDVIWVILSVEVGGLLGVTQQLSSFETEFNTQPQRNVQGDFNPFASPQKNKHDATDNSFRDPSGAWDRTQEPIQQDQNGLSHNAVNRASNGLQTNLSVVTYGQVRISHVCVCCKLRACVLCVHSYISMEVTNTSPQGDDKDPIRASPPQLLFWCAHPFSRTNL